MCGGRSPTFLWAHGFGLPLAVAEPRVDPYSSQLMHGEPKTKQKNMAPRFLVLDTESSVNLSDGRRVLVSLAYEVIEYISSRSTVLHQCYHIVRMSPSAVPDSHSERIHGIRREKSDAQVHSLRDVLQTLADTLIFWKVQVIVAHDAVADVALIITEGIRCGLKPRALLPVLRLICTKLACHGICAIPLQDEVHGSWKWPNLKESYDAVVCARGEDADQNKNTWHNAADDVQRCRDVFCTLVSMRRTPTPVQDPECPPVPK